MVLAEAKKKPSKGDNNDQKYLENDFFLLQKSIYAIVGKNQFMRLCATFEELFVVFYADASYT